VKFIESQLAERRVIDDFLKESLGIAAARRGFFRGAVFDVGAARIFDRFAVAGNSAFAIGEPFKRGGARFDETEDVGNPAQ
jgi:hypothetical protein